MEKPTSPNSSLVFCETIESKMESLHSPSKNAGSINLQTEKLPIETDVSPNSALLKNKETAESSSRDDEEENMPCTRTQVASNSHETSTKDSPTTTKSGDNEDIRTENQKIKDKYQLEVASSGSESDMSSPAEPTKKKKRIIPFERVLKHLKKKQELQKNSVTQSS